MAIRPINRATTTVAYPVARVRTRLVKPAEVPAAEPPASPLPDYEVGYARPPRHSRFQPGQSGNRAGRPKGAKGMKTLVKTLLTEKVPVRTPGGVKRMSKMEAALHKVAEKAFGGDTRALELLVKLYTGAVPDEVVAPPADGQTAATRAVEDDEALAALTGLLRDQLLANPQGEA